MRLIKDKNILLGLYLLCLPISILLLGNSAHTLKTHLVSEPVRSDNIYEIIEILPLEVFLQITDVNDSSPLIDRLTLEMIGGIPIQNGYVSQGQISVSNPD